MDKHEARARHLEARKMLSPEDVETKSAAIVASLKTLPVFTLAPAFLCYVSSKDNEVDTHALIQWLLANDRRVLVPISLSKGRLAWSRLDSLDELALGRFGIFEPRPEFLRIATPPLKSVAVVPGVAFSLECQRVGYGGGYYDRFLAAFGGTSIALAYEIQIVSHFASEPHDVPMDYVVTESNIYRRAGA